MYTSLKMLCLYLLGQNCLHLTYKPYWSSEAYSCKYGALSNIVIHTCINITEKMNLLKMCGSLIRLCLFMFRSIASNELNSLATIVTLSWLGGTEVKHPLLVRGDPCSIPGSGKGFYVWYIVLLLLCIYSFIYFCPKTNYLSQKFAISFAMFIYLVCLTYCKICDRL